jgi:hypothetical protein
MILKVQPVTHDTINPCLGDVFCSREAGFCVKSFDRLHILRDPLLTPSNGEIRQLQFISQVLTPLPNQYLLASALAKKKRNTTFCPLEA